MWEGRGHGRGEEGQDGELTASYGVPPFDVPNILLLGSLRSNEPLIPSVYFVRCACLGLFSREL